MDENYESRGFSNATQMSSPTQSVAMKKCPNCRADIEADSVFCEYCGSRVGTSTPVAANISTPTAAAPDGKLKAPLATGSLICSIVGLGLLFIMLVISADADEMLLGLMFYVGIAASIVGMSLGIAGLKKIKGNYSAYSNAPKLTVGKILGIIGVVSWASVMLLGIILVLAEEGIEGLLY